MCCLPVENMGNFKLGLGVLRGWYMALGFPWMSCVALRVSG